MLILDEVKNRYCTCLKGIRSKGHKCLECGRRITGECYATCSGFILNGYLCRDCHDRLDDCVPPEIKRKYVDNTLSRREGST